jgi:hypothetical protein
MEQEHELMTTTTLKIKIVKCSHKEYWYNDKVGHIFNVVDNCVRDFYVRKDTVGLGGVLKIDAEIVK